MTTPPTPSGWYPDPAGTGRQRWWDGATWTEFFGDAYPYTTPREPVYAAPPAPTVALPVTDAPKGGDDIDAESTDGSVLSGPAGPPPSPQKRPLTQGKKVALGIGAGVLTLSLVAAIAGAVGEDEESSTTAATRTTPAAPQPMTSAVIPGLTTTSAAPIAPRTKTTTPRPLGCQPAPPEYLDVINSSWLNGYLLTDVSAFAVGETWYIAGEITQAGKVRSRDDLFAAQDLFVTPVTATARIESTLPDLRKILDVNFLDDGAQKALDCARTY